MVRRFTPPSALLLLSLLLFLFLGLSARTPVLAVADTVTISEIRIDQPGSDVDEYVELAGPAGLTLDGLTYVVLGDGAGGSGTVEAAVALDGQTVPANGLLLVAEESLTLASADVVANLNFENSDNVTHLLVAGFTGANGDDLDTNDDGLLDTMPWTEIVDLIALVEEENPPSATEYHYGPPSVGPDGDLVPGHVFRCPDGWRIGAFGGGQDTPGADNACSGGEEPQEAKIHTVQGSGSSVALTGLVTVQAIVVGDYQQDDQLNGFFIQEEDADVDADPSTSEGIFVYCGACVADAAVGDLVQVTGVAEEFFNMSQIDVTVAGGAMSVASSGNPLPTPATITLPASGSTLDAATFENIEGMLVTIDGELFVSEYFQLARYGQLTLTAGARLRQFSDANAPGVAGYAAFLDDLNRKRIILDDDNNRQNAALGSSPSGDAPYFWPRPGLSNSNRMRGGDSISDLSGVLHWSWAGQSGTEAWRVRPVAEAFSYPFTTNNARPAVPEAVGGSLRVASFNVLNYFTTLDARGADSPAELNRQREKTAAAICALDADIVGLIEIENNGGVAAADLLDGAGGINASCGPYAYIDTGIIGTDEIAVAFIYKPATVTPSGTFALLDSSVDPRFLDTKNRPALAQTFTATATGGTLTVVVNHLKSKGSPCDDVGDPDAGDGQGNCNGTRAQAAAALVDWLATDPTDSGDSDFLIIGDLNSYRREDPITTLTAGADETPGTGDDYTDLLNALIGPSAYTYLFDGQLGYLDHALASNSLVGQVAGVTAWHINADEIPVFDYNDGVEDAGEAYFERESTALPIYEANAYRASDHDPVLVGLALRPAGGTLYLPLVATPAQPLPPPLPAVDAANEQRILDLLESQRRQQGRQALARDADLTQAARRHSNDMAGHNFTAHIGSDGSDGGRRMREANYAWQAWGEIIGWGFNGDATQMVAWWMNSAVHRDVLLSTLFGDVGAGYGYAAASSYGHYWTVSFGRRLPPGAAPAQWHYVCTYTHRGPNGGSSLRLYTPLPCETLTAAVPEP